MKNREIEKLAEEEVQALYEEVIKGDCIEKHSGFYWCSPPQNDSKPMGRKDK